MFSLSSSAPRISAIIPIYNGAATLEACIRSLLGQKGVELEILAIDDSSTDASARILSDLAVEDSRVKIIHHVQNQGLSRSWNEGIRLSGNNLLFLINQDCVIQGTNSLQRAVQSLEDLKAELVAGVPVLSASTALERVFLLVRAHRLDLSKARSIPWTEFKCDLVRREILSSVGSFDEAYRFSGEDQDLCYRMRRRGAHLFQIPELRYTIKVETQAGWIPHLEREYLYAETQAALLIRTSLGVLLGGGSSLGGERMRNRALAVLWPVFVLVGVLLYPVIGSLAFVYCAVLYLLRMIILISRLFESGYGLATREIPRVWLAGTLADITYAIGLGWGSIRYLLDSGFNRFFRRFS